MSRFWIITIGVFLLQETFSFNLVLLDSYRDHRNLWPIHVCFLATTLADFVIGDTLGRFIKRRASQTWLMTRLNAFFSATERLIGRFGWKLALVLMGQLAPTYINAMIATFLDLNRRDAFIFVILGELLWYGLLWSFVLSVAWIKNGYIAFAALVFISLAAAKFFRAATVGSKIQAPAEGAE